VILPPLSGEPPPAFAMRFLSRFPFLSPLPKFFLSLEDQPPGSLPCIVSGDGFFSAVSPAPLFNRPSILLFSSPLSQNCTSAPSEDQGRLLLGEYFFDGLFWSSPAFLSRTCLPLTSNVPCATPSLPTVKLPHPLYFFYPGSPSLGVLPAATRVTVEPDNPPPTLFISLLSNVALDPDPKGLPPIPSFCLIHLDDAALKNWRP